MNIDLKLRNKSHRHNALQNRCYICIQWTCVLYSIVITLHSNPPISQFNSPCNEFMSVCQCLYTILLFVFTLEQICPEYVTSTQT